MTEGNEAIAFVVGEEKELRDILPAAEVLPLLQGVLRCGARGAEITDTQGKPLARAGDRPTTGAVPLRRPLRSEGEQVGTLTLYAPEPESSTLQPLCDLLHEAVDRLLRNSHKRMLTTEIHTSVVHQSSDQLLEANRKLRISQAGYRKLAESLESKVEERTSELKAAYARLLQQEKMAAVGQLAAGVAHEINNPMGFLTSNLNSLAKYVARLQEMLRDCREALHGQALPPGLRAAWSRKWEALKLDLVLSDLEPLIQESLQGAERVRTIVTDLKGFSHIDDGAESVVDLNLEIERTLNVLGHRIPDDARVVRDFHPLPGFRCQAAQICQVFLNIILNALQARPRGLRLEVATAPTEEGIRVRFRDNGHGIPEEIRNRVFDPFYTTRDVGQGRGLGLTVVYEIVTSLGGTLNVESLPGRGTTVHLLLPPERIEDVQVR